MSTFIQNVKVVDREKAVHEFNLINFHKNEGMMHEFKFEMMYMKEMETTEEMSLGNPIVIMSKSFQVKF